MTQTNVIPFPAVRAEAVPKAAPASESTVNQGFDVKRYLPQTDSAKPIALVENNLGVHQIPHQIFEFLIKATESRVELAVFACILRYTSGYHRSTCEASTRFIADWTGLSQTSVRNGLVPLIAKKLVACLKKGNSFDDPSIYEVPVVKGYLESLQSAEPKKQPTSSNPASQIQKEQKKIESTPSQAVALNTLSAQYCAPPLLGTEHPVCSKKYNTNINTKKTLSESAVENRNHTTEQKPISVEIPKNISSYFSALTLPHKLMKEQKHFAGLRRLFSLQEISLGLDHVQKKGLPNGEPCHSPMAYLACSMPNVLPTIKAEIEAQQRQVQRQQKLTEEKAREQERESEESAQYAADVAEFEKAFPTVEQQQAYFVAFSKRFPLFAGKSNFLRGAAISEWGSQQRLNSNSFQRN